MVTREQYARSVARMIAQDHAQDQARNFKKFRWAKAVLDAHESDDSLPDCPISLNDITDKYGCTLDSAYAICDAYPEAAVALARKLVIKFKELQP